MGDGAVGQELGEFLLGVHRFAFRVWMSGHPDLHRYCACEASTAVATRAVRDPHSGQRVDLGRVFMAGDSDERQGGYVLALK